MGGFFAAALKEDCVADVFFGTDYHSHLGTRRAGMVIFGKDGMERAIHNIESSNFRPKFDKDILKMEGQLGIGCISDYEPQPLIVRSHLGNYAITTVGKINNSEELMWKLFSGSHSHFLEMSGGDINPTELTAALINQCDSFEDGIRYAQELIRGSMTLMVMTKNGIYAARDRLGRTPVEIGCKEDSRCICFESFSYLNLGYRPEKELGPGEICFVTPDGVETVKKPFENMRICTFLWIYYGFPASTYEGMNVEYARYECGRHLAMRDMKRGLAKPDIVAGVPDSGVAHAVGYSNESGVPYSRPFVKYTPTWPRSFMPTIQSRRNLIAKMKLVPIHELIDNKSMLLIDDSIVRGTTSRRIVSLLRKAGAREIHMRISAPPLIAACYYGTDVDSPDKLIANRHSVEEIAEMIGADSLGFLPVDALPQLAGTEGICTACFTGDYPTSVHGTERRDRFEQKLSLKNNT
jgi:amidophosphoribosyltransferase